MFEWILFAVTFLAVLIPIISWLYPGSKAVKVVKTIPGLDPSSKEDGNLGDVSRAGSLHEFLMDLHSRFGPISAFWWGQTYVVSIASPELLKEQHNVFDRPSMLFKSFETLIGSRSIQYANGPVGMDRRRTYDPLFAFDKMSKYLYYFEDLAKQTEAKWLQKGEEDHIPLCEDSFLYAIHAALVSMMGEYYKDEKTFLQFKTSYDLVWDEMEHAITNSTPRDEQKQGEFDKALAFLKSSIKEVISQRKKEAVHLQDNLVIDVLIEKYPDDEDTIASDAISFLVGGFHTTGNVLSWALYYLASNKDVQDKVCREIKSIIGDEGSVDENNYSDFVYLIQVIDETMRCAVVAPWAARFQESDSELGGYKIPPNTPVIQALGVLLKDDKLWPSPNKFDPDRFSPENKQKMSAYDFVPFGFAGKRKCPGYRFAYWDSVVLLATIVRRFEISMWADQVVTPVYGLVTHPSDEIWVKVTKRE